MRRNHCIEIDYTSYYTVWESVRTHYGPKPSGMSIDDRTELYVGDMGGYSNWLLEWNSEHGQAVGGQDVQSAVDGFGKWMVWRCVNGTFNYGNLPKRIRAHYGLTCAPCPYDSNTDQLRVELMLGFVPDQADHGNYYMQVANSGPVWGFECTYSGCPYLIDNGRRYFSI